MQPAVPRHNGTPKLVVGMVLAWLIGCGTAEDHDSSDLEAADDAGEEKSALPANGLTGSYFDNVDFTSPKLTRVDPTVAFSWGGGSPSSLMSAPDTFSVRWEGYVKANYSQTYTFYTQSDDGTRLWVNNQLLVNDWTVHGTKENKGVIALEAGKTYPIKLEYFENRGGAVASLLWSSSSQAKQIIPASQLFTSDPARDECPNDSNKTLPGICGCGVSDTDTDSDGTANCKDACPSDPAKIVAGSCGCNVPEGTCSGGPGDSGKTCGKLTYDPSTEKWDKNSCYLCKDGATDYLTIGRSGMPVTPDRKTCAKLDFDMIAQRDGIAPGNEKCHALQSQYRESCCNAACTPTPPPDNDPGPATPTFPKGKFTSCDVCDPSGNPNGQFPLKPYNVATIASVPGNPSCSDLYWMGRTDNIPSNICYPIQSLMKEGCGCIPPAKKGTEAWCDICPKGQYPLRPNVTPTGLGMTTYPTCSQLYWMGRKGELSPSVCQKLQTEKQNVCGCLPASP